METQLEDFTVDPDDPIIDDPVNLSFWTKVKLALMYAKIYLGRKKDQVYEHVLFHKKKYAAGAIAGALLTTGLVIFFVYKYKKSS